MQSTKNIAILGAGPIGSVLAILLARKGFNVEIYERRSNPTKSIDHTKRQINFGVSLRGVQAFQQIQVWEKIQKHSIPMNSRTYHNRDGTIRSHQYGRRNESIYSIRSEVLTNLLLKQLGQYESIKIHYEIQINDIHIEKSSIQFIGEDGSLNLKEFAQIFMTDDTFKIIKRNLIFQKGFKFNQDYSNFGYIETQIPANSMNEFAYNPNSFHMWTNDDFHIIAMPNKNKTFTCNLFLPLEGEISFETIRDRGKFNKFMRQYFPELTDQMVYNDSALEPDRVGRLYDYKCYPWAFNNFCLFGNAAHQIFPYFGQGLNAGLEDCVILSQLIEKHNEDWKAIMKSFQIMRKPNTDAITDLAKQNFETLKTQMFDDDFQEKKAIINYLSDNYEELFMSQYQLIEFSNIDFEKAKTFAKVEDEIVRQVRMIPNYEKIIQNNKKDSIVRQILKIFVGKYDVEITAVEIINQLGVLSKNQEVILLPNIGQFEIGQVINCSVNSVMSFDEQIKQAKIFEGDFSRARVRQDSLVQNNQILNQTTLGLCMELNLQDKSQIDLKTLQDAYDKAILRSIQQSMKNINNIYKVSVIKSQTLNKEIVNNFSPESLDFLKEKGFQVLATSGILLKGQDEDIYLNKFLDIDNHMIVENLNLSEIELGAYIVSIESFQGHNQVAPSVFKARKILNAELLDIYAHKKREVYYSEYLAVEEIISLMRNRTDYLEEKLFIRVHQINEIAMQQSIITLEALIKIFQSKQVMENLEHVEEYIHQILRFFIVQKETNFVLCNMSTKNFVHGFRSSLGTASGVQSCQFYVMQMLLGLGKDRQILYDPVKLQQLKEYDIQKLKSFQNHESLFKVIQDWLLDFYNENEEVRKIGNIPHLDDIISGCQDFSREVAITILYLLNNQDCLQYKIVDYILKFEASFLAFLDSHIVLVDYHLANKRGTGGSAGGNYLRQSKMTQIIWRDLYHLQEHSNSVYNWKDKPKLSIQRKDIIDPKEEILRELSNTLESKDILNLTQSNFLIQVKLSIQQIIQDNFLKVLSDESTLQNSDNTKKEGIQSQNLVDISKRYSKLGFQINPDSIILSRNNSDAIKIVINGFLNQNDNIIVMTPINSKIHQKAKQNKIDLRYLNVLNKDCLELQSERLKQLIDKNTRAIFIPNFAEIIGQTFSQEELETLLSIAEYHKLFIVYDEQSYLSSNQTTKQINQISRKIPTLIISGISVPEKMAEFDLSWLIPIDSYGFFDQVIKSLQTLKQTYSTTDVSIITRHSLIEILDFLHKERDKNLLKVEEQAEFESIKLTLQRISQIRGLTFTTQKQQLSKNILIHIDLDQLQGVEDDIDFVKKFIKQESIYIHPSQIMLQPNKLIMTLDKDNQNLVEGIDKIENFCKSHLKN